MKLTFFLGNLVPELRNLYICGHADESDNYIKCHAFLPYLFRFHWRMTKIMKSVTKNGVPFVNPNRLVYLSNDILFDLICNYSKLARI